MREYRIIRKKKEDLYSPQVRKDKYLFTVFGIKLFHYKTYWARIGIHPDGFGLYPPDDYLCGKSFIEARQIIMDYEEQFMDEEPPYIFSYESQASIRYDIEKRNNMKPKYNRAVCP